MANDLRENLARGSADPEITKNINNSANLKVTYQQVRMKALKLVKGYELWQGADHRKEAVIKIFSSIIQDPDKAMDSLVEIAKKEKKQEATYTPQELNIWGQEFADVLDKYLDIKRGLVFIGQGGMVYASVDEDIFLKIAQQASPYGRELRKAATTLGNVSKSKLLQTKISTDKEDKYSKQREIFAEHYKSMRDIYKEARVRYNEFLHFIYWRINGQRDFAYALNAGVLGEAYAYLAIGVTNASDNFRLNSNIEKGISDIGLIGIPTVTNAPEILSSDLTNTIFGTQMSVKTAGAALASLNQYYVVAKAIVNNDYNGTITTDQIRKTLKDNRVWSTEGKLVGSEAAEKCIRNLMEKELTEVQQKNLETLKTYFKIT